jgi:hypothetical protein
MAETKLLTFHQGVVTARDAGTLNEGELSTAEACEYREGSLHLYKQPGRTSSDIGTFSKADIGNAIQAIHRFQYEIGDDKLVFYSAAGEVYEADVWTAAASSNAVDDATGELTGLDTSAIPHFSALRDRWLMVNGVDENFIREPNAVPTTGWTTGNWRAAGMPPPDQVLTVGTPPSVAGEVKNSDAVDTNPVSGSASSDYNDIANAQDGDISTHAFGRQSIAVVGQQDQTYGWAADFAGTIENGVVRITHSADDTYHGGGPSWPYTYQPPPPAPVRSLYHRHIIKVEYTKSGEEATLYEEEFGVPYGFTETIVNIDDKDLNEILVTCSTKNTLAEVFGDWTGNIIGRVHTVRADNQAAEQTFTTNTLYYGYTELYRDSDEIEHQSNISPLTEVIGQDAVYGIKLEGLPATPKSGFTQSYAIYRSIDETGGGYPYMYRVADIPIADVGPPGNNTTWTDTGDRSFTDVAEQGPIYPTLQVLYPDGSTFVMEVNDPPPRAKKVIPFQGSAVYVPVDEPRLYYSIPASLSPLAIEQVPSAYYLEFVTPFNDTINSVELGNSGRSLMVYFTRYTMLVNFLPQSSDPGVFDQRITEYVSNTRGAAGVHATTEVTLGSGRTFAVAVDALGVWATDGVSEIQEWSNDIDWTTVMSGVTLANVQFVHNPLMDRLELLYLDSTQRKELHFYYGRMKQDADGNTAPLITGPHQASSAATDGWRCKHYANEGGSWVGWSGDNSTGGDIFVERESAADASLAYDGSNTYVPFNVVTGDYYFGGLGRATILEFGYPKFEGSTTKALNPTTSSNLSGLFGTFQRDGSANTYTKSKLFTANTQRKVYWHAYADRHALQIKNIDSTALPALVGYEVEVRDGGTGRDK